ncbi:insulinase family protein [Ahrensia kielensis]|uniref:Insulinase family protein n=1 Tax=Ahrensia kielensis TaxID=76980 RepID=A0ABU9T999_9HYPH
MIRLLLVCITAFSLTACGSDKPTASSELSPEGVAYTLLATPANEDVTIHLAWATDWSYREDTNKAAPFIGTQLILAGGAEGYRAGDAGERYADLSSQGNIYVAASDYIIGELTFKPANMPETIDIANAHLRAPTLDQMWFERIRDNITQNHRETQAQSFNAGFDAVRWAIFGKQPLRNALSVDDPETLKEILRNDIVAWHQEVFTRAPEAIVVAGGIKAKLAGEAVDALLQGLPERRTTTIIRNAQPDYSPKRILLHMPDVAVTTLTFIAPLAPTKSGGEIEDLLLIDALGGGEQSVLHDAVRTQFRASYGFEAGFANYTYDHRLLFMGGEVETEKLADVESIVRQTYRTFRQTGLNDDLVARKAVYKETFATLADFIIDQARSELQSALDGFKAGRTLELVAELESATNESINDRLKNDYPDVDDWIVIAVSPDVNALPDACVITQPQDATECP